MSSIETETGVPPLPPDLLAEVQRDLGALARSRRRWLAVFAVAGLGVALGFGFMWGRHPDGSWVGPGIGELAHLAITAGFAVAGLTLVALAFGIILPAGRKLVAVPALGVGAGLIGLGTTAALYAGLGATHEGGGGAGCLSVGAVVAFAMVALVVLIGRRLMRRHAPSSGLFGVGVGLLALIPLSMACGDASVGHLMLWHGLIPVASGVIAALIWRVFRPAID